MVLVSAAVWLSLITFGQSVAPSWVYAPLALMGQPVPTFAGKDTHSGLSVVDIGQPDDASQPDADSAGADATGREMPADTQGADKDTSYDSAERRIGVLTNAFREKHSLPTLEWDEWLRTIAREHSRDMAENDFFSHVNMAGDGPTECGLKAEYYCLGGGLGKNIGFTGTGTPERHMEGWISSPGHRENMLDSKYRRIGVGVYPGYSSGYGQGYFATMVLC